MWIESQCRRIFDDCWGAHDRAKDNSTYTDLETSRRSVYFKLNNIGVLPGPEDYKRFFCNREAFESMELVALATMCTQPGQLKRQKLKDLVEVFGDRMDGGRMFRVECKTLKFKFIMNFTWFVDEFCGEGFALKLLTNKSLSGSFTDAIIELLNYTPVTELSDEAVAELSDEAVAELKAAAKKKEDFITKLL